MTPLRYVLTELARRLFQIFTDTEITRISSAKGVYSFWDAKGNEVRRAGSFDNVAYSDVPLSEILEG
jgi:hypothetical protein